MKMKFFNAIVFVIVCFVHIQFILSINITSLIPNTQCRIDQVEQVNSKHLNFILNELTQSTFFRLVHVDLSKDDCMVEDNESAQCNSGMYGSEIYQSTENSCHIAKDENHTINNYEIPYFSLPTTDLARTDLSESETNAFSMSFDICSSSFWEDLCSKENTIDSPINLQLNPERNTGWNGNEVWTEIYNTIELPNSALYRLISGWHSSISTHIAYYNKFYNNKYHSDSKLFNMKVGNDQSRIENMYYLYLFLLRAIAKSKETLASYDYRVNVDESETIRTNQLMRHFLDSTIISTCNAIFNGFDEHENFSFLDNTIGSSLKGYSEANQLKKVFQSIQRIVTCKVTCQKCLLHAKIALRGIATAFKLIAVTDGIIKRDDLVALINTLKSVSDALIYSEIFKLEYDNTNERLRYIETLDLPNDTRLEVIQSVLEGNEEVAMILKSITDEELIRQWMIKKFGTSETLTKSVEPDVIICGGGLAGMVSAISAADNGAIVYLFEKEPSLGGNSAKASSGINKAIDEEDYSVFYNDTVKSAGITHGNRELERILINQSYPTFSWLEKRFSLTLSQVGLLGGHSKARTHRPEEGLVGAEIVASVIREINNHPNVFVYTNTSVKSLVKEESRVSGVRLSNNTVISSKQAVVITTGGFGYFSKLLKQYRSDLFGMPTTLGSFTTGEGLEMAHDIGADLIDMEFIQIHPTGFIDPNNKTNQVKFLAAEILRGIGGILVNPLTKQRFCNELGTRKYVVEEMQKTNSQYFYLILSENQLDKSPIHKKVYTRKGLLREINYTTLIENYVEKQEITVSNPHLVKWFIGEVQPVIHFTMGGIAIDSFGRVLDKNKQVITGLYSAGEASGGVHGENRLGGNSLLECIVFGKIIGDQMISTIDKTDNNNSKTLFKNSKMLNITLSITEVHNHNKSNDCYMILFDDIYDFSGYSDEHPGGSESITTLCGKDGTKEFSSIHTKSLLHNAGFTKIAKVSY